MLIDCSFLIYAKLLRLMQVHFNSFVNNTRNDHYVVRVSGKNVYEEIVILYRVFRINSYMKMDDNIPHKYFGTFRCSYETLKVFLFHTVNCISSSNTATYKERQYNYNHSMGNNQLQDYVDYYIEIKSLYSALEPR